MLLTDGIPIRIDECSDLSLRRFSEYAYDLDQPPIAKPNGLAAGLALRQSSDGDRNEAAYSASSRITLISSDLPSNPIPGSSGMVIWPSMTFTPSGKPP